MKASPSDGNDGTASRRRPVLALALAALVVTGACSNGSGASSFPFGDGTAASTTSTTSSSITTSPPTTTTTVEPRVTTTTRLPSTPTTTRATTPALPPAEPRVTASPAGAAPGTRVSIAGDGFVAEHWRTPNVPLWLAGGPPGCDFFAGADHEVRVTADGRLTGSFVVPSHGACRQSSQGDVRMLAGTYRIVYQCTACTIGEFMVTKSTPPATANCDDVGFSPNSDNLASDIVAHGLSCEEAETVVRKVGGPLGPINGAARGEADGFTCVRTSQEEAGLPSAAYECTRGGQRITFIRT